MAYHIRRVLLDQRAKNAAMRRVKHAVAVGHLPNLKKQRTKCADCHERAVVYDHRLYSEPLKVEPVCKSCNGRRGFASDQAFVDAITGEPRSRAEYLAERAPSKPRHADCTLSAFSGRPDYLKSGAERMDWHGMRMRGRGRIAFEKKLAYLDSTHEYRLERGHVDTGLRKTMTGREAKILNIACEKDFIAQLQADSTKRLYRWCLTSRLRKAA